MTQHLPSRATLIHGANVIFPDRTVHPQYHEVARCYQKVHAAWAEAVGLVVMHTDEAAVLARFTELLSGAPSG